MVKQKDLRVKQIVVYIITIVLSIVFIIVGRNLAMQGYPDWGAPESTSYSAAVTEIVSVTETDSGQEIVFAAQLKSGPYKGSAVQGLQTINYNYYPVQEPVEKGSKILVYPDSEDDTTYIMLEYMRSNAIIVLGVIFALALVLFGHIKGLNTLISLVFTCLAVFVVFLPSVLSGKIFIYGPSWFAFM